MSVAFDLFRDVDTTRTQTALLFRDRPLTLDSGAQVRNLRVAYRTWGSLSPAKDNAVLILHALTGDANADVWWPALLREGGALDPNRSFLVCANVVGGSAGSTSAAELGHDLTIRDMVRVQAELLDLLGVDKVTVIGGSMGGMLALSFVTQYPDRTERAVIVGAPQRQSAWAAGFNHAKRAAIALDPERGLEIARMFAMLTYRSPLSLELSQSGESPCTPGARAIDTYLDHQGEKLRRRFDSASYVCLTKAMDAFDVPDAALRRNEVPTLVVGISSDELYPASEVRLLAAKLGESTYWELQSPHGHDAFLIDADNLARRVKSFLG
ncbi:homoserine O-acetyltransferase family protein [Deinococcus yavapaiensis]|uniref:Homoserine O-acetyltransferase n=1 Tax=Deinococcus yavapaiensis KR-236 TaxID=694435 RepID=A0A318S7M7_9DEIO|nr:homoserine O-acetyltransferase [Deinococcus yavapaiensis]PYE54916.1 homoserine O-acetyltransferase [Deinococcus yavapaiensis KR-236]